MPIPKGFKHSEETKKKISDNKKGKKPVGGTLDVLARNRFKKGQIPWNKNKKQLKTTGDLNPSKREDVRLKISRALKGRIFSDDWKNNISKGKKGKKSSQGFIDKCKLRVLEKNSNWKGGKSFEPYSLEFNKNLKEAIRNRDGRKCQICGQTELDSIRNLSVHHIDYDKRNCNPDNLISLCHKCHSRTNGKRSFWISFFNKQIR